jgi:hypothetical protein
MPTIIRSLMAFILFLGLASSQTMSAEDDIDPRAARRPMVATIIKYPPSVREGQTFAIEVKVVDARTKKPVEGALVENIVSGYSIIVRQGRTGSNGIGSTAKCSPPSLRMVILETSPTKSKSPCGEKNDGHGAVAVASLLQFGPDLSQVNEAMSSPLLTKDKCYEAGNVLGCSV